MLTVIEEVRAGLTPPGSSLSDIQKIWARAAVFTIQRMSLLDALLGRAFDNAVVAEIRGFDVELPSALGFDVRHTDREVILARTDMPSGYLRLSNAQTGHFAVSGHRITRVW